MWAFSLPFCSLACGDGAIWYYFTLCNCVDTRTPRETMTGVVKYKKENTSSLQKHFRHRHAKEFTSFLEFLELRKTSQIEYSSEIITEGVSRKRRNADKISVGGRFSDYLLPCHPYGNIYLKQGEFEVNDVALMAHPFTSLLLVDHECVCNLTQDIDARLRPVGRSKLSQSLIPT